MEVYGNIQFLRSLPKGIKGGTVVHDDTISIRASRLPIVQNDAAAAQFLDCATKFLSSLSRTVHWDRSKRPKSFGILLCLSSDPIIAILRKFLGLQLTFTNKRGYLGYVRLALRARGGKTQHLVFISILVHLLQSIPMDINQLGEDRLLADLRFDVFCGDLWIVGIEACFLESNSENHFWMNRLLQNGVGSWREDLIARYSGQEFVWGSGEAAIQNACRPPVLELLIARGWRV
jgi:hypothetical protein